jgi:tetratricopeptide (TPR) repeat protein
LLYELLAGSTPFGRKRLNEAAFDEMLRIIREEEPPKPSTRLSSSDALPSIAANRSLEPLKLNRLVQGELDWIVMKALEKDRSRRYETASSFAADIERHLHDEPVEAGPPSAGYRFRKFAKRNKVALAIAALAMFFLIVLGGGVGWSIYDRTARQARVTGQLETILDEVSRLERAEKWSEALTTARRAEPALAAGEAALEIQGRVREALADLELVQRLDEIRAQSGTVWGMHALSLNPADQDYAAAFREAGIDVDALPVKESAERITARRPIAAAVLPALDDWVAVRSVGKNEPEIRRLVGLLQAADPDTWRQRMRDALARKDWPALDNLLKSTDLDRQPAATLTFLCAALQAKGNYPDELLILRRAQWKYPADYWINIRLGTHLIWAKSPNDIRDGIGYTRAAAALRPQSAHPVMILGVGYNNLGQYDEAIACYRKAIELAPNHSTSYTNLGNTLGKKGLHEEAIAAYEQAITLAPQNDSLADHNMTLANGNLAWLLANSVDVQRRDPDKAVRIAKQLVEQFPNDCRNWTALGLALYRSGDWQGAIDALKKSEEIPPVRFESCVNALLLAMAHWQLSEQDEARRWYGKAVEWMEKHQAEDETLRRFQEEAEELLKITDEEPTAKPPVEVK